jgi:hypothetical protein
MLIEVVIPLVSGDRVSGPTPNGGKCFSDKQVL